MNKPHCTTCKEVVMVFGRPEYHEGCGGTLKYQDEDENT